MPDLICIVVWDRGAADSEIVSQDRADVVFCGEELNPDWTLGAGLIAEITVSQRVLCIGLCSVDIEIGGCVGVTTIVHQQVVAMKIALEGDRTDNEKMNFGPLLRSGSDAVDQGVSKTTSSGNKCNAFMLDILGYEI